MSSQEISLHVSLPLCRWSEKGRRERREHGGGVGEPAERMMVGDKCWGECEEGSDELEVEREKERIIEKDGGKSQCQEDTHTQLHIQSSTR